MNACRLPRAPHPPRRQHGAALMVMLVILILGAATIFVTALSSSAIPIARDKVTADALAKAKEALIGYAASVNLSNPSANSPRPGNLPCPDISTTGTGTAAASCSGNALGRLPWKTLGLPDLRDSSGEQLWYAVSKNFKKSTTACNPSTGVVCLNSDTLGTITIRDSSGNIINNGCTAYGLPNCPNPGASDAAFGTGAAAVIIAPGAVLTRTDKATAQDRSSAGFLIASNYLDIAPGEDNATLADSTTDGFIQGRIKDSNGNIILNDQIMVVTQDNIMQAAQKRVAGEVRQCLNGYASTGVGLYPWAAPVTDLNYIDTSGTLFGRVPVTPFNDTPGDNGAMNDQWGGTCNINSGSGWWLNWKELVFYGLSDAYSPNQNTGAALLTVNPPSATADKQFVVIVAGKTLTTLGQSRGTPANKQSLGNYLESPNPTSNPPPFPTTFSQQQPTSTFNDTVEFQ